MQLHVRLFTVFLLAALLSQCGVPSPPQCRNIPRASRGDPALFLADARSAWQTLASSSNSSEKAAARSRYNTAVARLFDQFRCDTTNYDQKAALLGTRIDTSRTLGTGLRLEDLDAIVPASTVSTKRVGQRHTEPGIGLPLVGWKTTAAEGKPRYDFAPPTGIPLNLTAILDFDQKPLPAWRFLYPGHVSEITLGHRREKLAVDWSAPGALYWRMSTLDDLDLAKVFLPSRFTEETKLFAATPYSSKRIPLILVHGLKSSPGTYRVMYNDLISQKWFRKNYQVWFFSYPTGTSWAFNAAVFREEIRKATEYARQHGPLDKWNRMVIVGHSMGGVVSHSSLIQPGERVYDSFFDKPIGQLKVDSETRDGIRRLTLYQPLQSPKRVIFMATPHQGSPLADRFFSHWAANLIRLPKKLTIDLLDVAMTEIGDVIQDGRLPPARNTSIGTLSPSYKGYPAMNHSPFRANLKRHSIIGDGGKGNSPDSSDGIVPYWSSHISPVESELIVPAHHSLTGHPETIAEVQRILQLHLQN